MYSKGWRATWARQVAAALSRDEKEKPLRQAPRHLMVRSISVVMVVVVCGCVGFADRQPVDVPGALTATDAAVAPVDAGLTPKDAGPALDSGASPADAGVADAGAQDAGGPSDPCSAVQCGAHARCLRGACECLPGFVANGAACDPPPVGTPASRTENEVCTAYKASQQRNASGDGFTAGGSMCDPGTLSRDALDDALRRLNFLRWHAGLGPVTDEANANRLAQACSVTSAWNPVGVSAHSPQPGAVCYSSDAAAGAGSSNIAWGSGSAADEIDQWFVDNGNFTTFGHRRWLLYPPLDPVGIGHYRGGNNYGSAGCIQVFNGGGHGPSPAWFSFPPAGFVPTSIAQWTWTVHGNSIPQQGATATVTRLSDSMSLPVDVEVMVGSYGWLPAVSLVRQGWNPVAGETYRVVLSSGANSLQYDVSPVSCP